jgi:hypothetical protein
MVRHVVLCKFRNSVSAEQRENTMDMLCALGRSVSEVQEWSVGKQALPSATAYDVAIVSGFENMEALERYRNHPNHVKVKDFLKGVADLVVVDYEYSPE